jgi:hypothetical protein
LSVESITAALGHQKEISAVPIKTEGVMRNLSIAMIAVALTVGITPTWAQETKGSEKGEAAEAARNAPALASALKDVKVSLADGLKAAETQGKPISGKFEIEDGKLQLSVYTMKDGKYSEVIVDHRTGKIAKAEAITEKEDLAEAKKQAAGMAKAQVSLADAVAKVEKANPGYHAVSIAAELEGGANADVTLLKGATTKQVDEKL